MKGRHKAAIKTVLTKAGLYRPLRRAKEVVDRIRYRRLRRTTTFVADLDPVTVRFSTEDPYSNRWFFPRYANGGLHEPQVTHLLVDILTDSSCFIDVGANLGWYTCVAASQIRDGIVHSVEMDDLNLRLLEANIRLNGFSNVVTYNLAISDEPGTVNYTRSTDRPAANFRLQLAAIGRGHNTVSVPSTTLDKLCADQRLQPDVIKIDVEGAEGRVIAGMKTVLQTVRPQILLEVHPDHLQNFGDSVDRVIGTLSNLGYRLSEIEGKHARRSRPRLRRVETGAGIRWNTMLFAVPTS